MSKISPVSTFDFRIIPYQATYDLRFNILRPHQPIEACYYPADDLEENFHVGAFCGKELISIGSFFQETHPDIQGKLQYRLRGMATKEIYRGQYAGKGILTFGEQVLKEKNVDTWWCNARVTAADFYLKFGMIQVGDIYEIKPIGMHKLMCKTLG